MRTKFMYGLLAWGLLIFMISINDSRFALSEEGEKANSVITPLPGVPTDFKLIYDFGATHAAWGRTRFTITANGAVVVEKSRVVHGAGLKRDLQRCQLTAGELAGLWKQIQEAKFFELEKHYANTRIRDGSSSYITINADGKEHSVTVLNTHEQAYDQIVYEIEKITNKKLSKKAAY